MMIPIIAIIGHQNVGKSTLFNRLTHTRNALVADFPGLTRDRKYCRAEWQGYQFIIIDTGGIVETNEPRIETLTNKQTIIAIDEADIILFMVDIRAGLISSDEIIAQHLRNKKKSIFLVANKADNTNYMYNTVGEFYTLGMGRVFIISAVHGVGVSHLLNEILSPLVQENVSFSKNTDFTLINNHEKDKKQPCNPQLLPIKITIVGRPNVGKSTLSNLILGEERVLVSDVPGTTRDSTYIPISHDKQEYILIDTAGVRKRSKTEDYIEKLSIIKTMQAIEDANVVLLLIDGREGVYDDDLSLLRVVLNSGRPIVIVINKWDGVSAGIRNKIRENLYKRLGFIDFARINFISALYGQGITDLFKSIKEAYQCSTNRISTSLLTNIMRLAITENQPPFIHGRRIKPKYAHAGGYNPPIIVIHGTQVKKIPDTYRRYLINYFRRSLNIMGSPILIQFNEASNPFSDYSNKLTLRQHYKRKRLIRLRKSKK